MILCGLSIYPYCYFIHFCPSIIFTLSVKSPSFQIYTIRSFVSCLQLYLLVFLPSLPRGAAAFPFLWWDYLYHAIPIATPNTQQWSHFTSLVSVVIMYSHLKIWSLEPLIRKNGRICLSWSGLSHSIWSFLVLPTQPAKFTILFCFTAEWYYIVYMHLFSLSINQL